MSNVAICDQAKIYNLNLDLQGCNLLLDHISYTAHLSVLPYLSSFSVANLESVFC